MAEDKPGRKGRQAKPTGHRPDVKILAVLKEQVKILNEIREILDNTWRDRRPL